MASAKNQNQPAPSEQAIPTNTPTASDAKSPPSAAPVETAAGEVPVQQLCLRKACGGAPAGVKVGDVLAEIKLAPGVSMHFIADAFHNQFVELK